MIRAALLLVPLILGSVGQPLPGAPLAGPGPVTLIGDVDGLSNANDLDETAVETELESVLDLNQCQGQISDTQIADAAVDGGAGGEIADDSITSSDIGPDAIGASEIATGAVDFSELSGTLGDAQIAAGAVDGGAGGEIQDDSLTTADLAPSSVGESELGVTCAGLDQVRRNAADNAFECFTPSAGSSNFVEVELDFGVFPGSNKATEVVTGQAWVLSTSIINCQVTMFASADRADGAEDPIIEEFWLGVSARVAATGFTVTGRPSLGKAVGKYTVHCIGG